MELAIDELQRRFDERVRTATARLDLVGQLNALRQRVETLEAALGIESPAHVEPDIESGD